MIADAARAAGAYAQIARLGADGADRTGETKRAAFGRMLETAIGDAAAALRAGETAAAQVATGEASLVDVATAVSAAEVTLETAIAVRNKVVEAYQEIMRMPI